MRYSRFLLGAFTIFKYSANGRGWASKPYLRGRELLKLTIKKALGLMAGIAITLSINADPLEQVSPAFPRLAAEVQVSPHICLLADNNVSCADRIRISWRSDRRESFCLIANQPAPLKCWNNSDSGELELDIDTAETIVYELRDYETLMVVFARAEFKVVQDNKKYRRSRRNPWSFF